MHIVLTTLDSFGTLSYVVAGLALIAGSKLVRRVSMKDAAPIANSGSNGEIQVRIRSRKVVSIERNRRVLVSSTVPVRRVGNFS